MANTNIKQNRGYFNTIFLSTLNTTVGENFYTLLFSIYYNTKEFITIRETKTEVSPADLNSQGLSEAITNYTSNLNAVIENINSGVYDEKIKQKLKIINTNYSKMIQILEGLNSQLNPLAHSAEHLKALVQSVAKAYKELQQIGTKRIFSAACKEDCRVNFLSRVGNSMEEVFAYNWNLAQTECKLLITLANTSMQVLSRCPEGVEPISEANIKKVKNAIFNLEHISA